MLPVLPLMSRIFETTVIGGEELNGFQRFMQARGVEDVMWNTLWLGLGSMGIAMILGASLAFCVHMLPGRLQGLLAFTPVLPLIIPQVAHVAGFVFLLSPENGYINTILRATPFFSSAGSGPIDVYTMPWIIIVTGVSLSSFVYLFVFSGLQSLGEEYGLAARVNGANTWRVLFTVTIPMLRPTFVYSAIMSLLLALGQFTAPLMLGRRQGIDVITTRIYETSVEYPIDYPMAATFGTPLLIVAIVLIIFQRSALGNQKRFVGSGMTSRSQATVSTRSSILAAIYVVTYVFLVAVLPILALVYVSLSSYWSGTISMSGLSLNNITAGIQNPAVGNAITTTLSVSLISLVLAIVIGLLISVALVNKDKIWPWLAFTLDVVASLPLAIPAALIGFGFLFAFSVTGIGLIGTNTALVIGFTTIMIPYSVRYQLAALITLGQSTTESSRVSGASSVRTLFQIVFPLVKNGIASAAAIMFILLSHEFGVSLLLRGQENTVLSVLLFDQYNGGSYPMVAVIALIMTALTSIGVILALLFGGTKALEKM